MDKHLTHERAAASGNGFVYLFLGIALALAAIALFVTRPGPLMLAVAVVLMLGTLWCLTGLYMLQPNQAALLTLFGSYRGTDRVGGLRWANVFYSKDKISVRAHNFNSEKLKVNDQRCNPISSPPERTTTDRSAQCPGDASSSACWPSSSSSAWRCAGPAWPTPAGSLVVRWPG